MTACIGDPCADVARTCLLLQYGELPYANIAMRKIAQTFGNYIGRQYLKEYERLSGISEHDARKWLLPVVAGRLRERITPREKQYLLKLVRNLLTQQVIKRQVGK